MDRQLFLFTPPPVFVFFFHQQCRDLILRTKSFGTKNNWDLQTNDAPGEVMSRGAKCFIGTKLDIKKDIGVKLSSCCVALL